MSNNYYIYFLSMLVLESYDILICCQMIERAIFSSVYIVIILYTVEQSAVTECTHKNIIYTCYCMTQPMLLAGNEAIIIYHM